MCKFQGRNFLRRGECKTREKFNFFEKWQNGDCHIQVENLEFFYISDDETNFTVEIVSRNLVTQLNFVKFRDSKNFMFFYISSVE